MKHRNMMIALVASSVAVGSVGLRAQGYNPAPPDPKTPQPGLQDQALKPPTPAGSATEGSDLKATSIIGQTVYSDTGERLGRVQDLIVSLQSHSVPFAIVGYGGTLGIGETRVAVPLTEIKWSGESHQLTMAATKEQFEVASPTPTGQWMAKAGENWIKNVDRFYGQPGQAGASRFERQENTGAMENREPVRNPLEQLNSSTNSTNLPPEQK